MKKRLSTSLTYFWKYVFSGIWLIGCGVGAILSFWHLGNIGLLVLVGWFAGFILLNILFLRAKKAYIDDSNLYVSNLRKTLTIPLDMIKEVSHVVVFSPRPIYIRFSQRTIFGEKIMFIGYSTFSLPFSTHPAVIEIKTRVKRFSTRQNKKPLI